MTFYRTFSNESITFVFSYSRQNDKTKKQIAWLYTSATSTESKKNVVQVRIIRSARMKNLERETRHSREQLLETNYPPNAVSLLSLIHLPLLALHSNLFSTFPRPSSPASLFFIIFFFLLARFNFSVLHSASASTILFLFLLAFLSAPFSSLFSLLSTFHPRQDPRPRTQSPTGLLLLLYEIRDSPRPSPSPSSLFWSRDPQPPLIASMCAVETHGDVRAIVCELYWQTLRILDHAGLGMLANISPDAHGILWDAAPPPEGSE